MQRGSFRINNSNLIDVLVALAEGKPCTNRGHYPRIPIPPSLPPSLPPSPPQKKNQTDCDRNKTLGVSDDLSSDRRCQKLNTKDLEQNFMKWC